MKATGPNTGLSTMLVPSCKIYEGGFFVPESPDPDIYNKGMRKMKKHYETDDIINIKKSIQANKELDYKMMASKLYVASLKDENGIVNIPGRYKKKYNKDNGAVLIAGRKNEPIRYKTEDGFLRDEDSNIIISRTLKIDKDDDNNYIIKRKRRDLGIPIVDGCYVINRDKKNKIIRRDKKR